MDVDKARHESRIAEVDGFRAGGMRDMGADFGDAFALDEYFAWGEDFAGLDVEEAGGVEDDWLSRRLRLGERGRRNQEGQEAGGQEAGRQRGEERKFTKCEFVSIRNGSGPLFSIT